MKDHDLAIYIMDDYPFEVYYGDSLISKGLEDESLKNPKVKYYMEYDPDKKEYVIYMNQPEKMYIYPVLSDMVEIERYKDPQIAIDALKSYNLKGFNGTLPADIYSCIISYRSSDITLNQCIMGIISSLGYKETAEFQMLMETSIVYNLDNKRYKTKLPEAFLEFLQPLRDRTSNLLYKLYDGLYGIFLKYNFFQDKKYDPDIEDDIDLSDPIKDIMDLFLFKMK